jgi:hypothetical protein
MSERPIQIPKVEIEAIKKNDRRRLWSAMEIRRRRTSRPRCEPGQVSGNLVRVFWRWKRRRHGGRSISIDDDRAGYGTRSRVIECIEAHGGKAVDTPPTRASSYLVIGFFASRDWYATNYGRKIERAVELRNGGNGIAIISEEHWKAFLAKESGSIR